MHLTTTLPLWLTLTTTLLAPTTTATDATLNAPLIASAKLAATRLDRAALFTAPNSSVFDFTAHAHHTFAPGGVVTANAATFPYVAGNGMALAMLFLGPCAVVPAHLHPRAANYVVSVAGSTVTYVVEEDGAAAVRATLGEGMMTIFPRGSVHMMENTGCTRNTLVSALSAEDAGTLTVAPTLFAAFPPALVQLSVGDALANASLVDLGRDVPGVGTGVIWGRPECLRACGLLDGMGKGR